MENILKQIESLGIMPVAVIEDTSICIDLAKALIAGGISAIEVTFRTKEAKEAISLITKSFPDMLVGAGTVLSIEQVDEALSAGAKFIVAPGFNPKVVEYCQNKNVSIFPGVATPSEIELALSYGLKILKFFPAKQLGGLDYIKAVSAPYTQVKFMPTGGIDMSNLGEYLASKKIFACGGSFMIKSDLLKERNFAKIEELSRQAVNIVRDVRGE